MSFQHMEPVELSSQCNFGKLIRTSRSLFGLRLALYLETNTLVA